MLLLEGKEDHCADIYFKKDKEVNLNDFIDECNRKIMQYRNATSDVFLTSFKGLRKDGRYRRRLDFNTAKNIMSSVLEEMIHE